MFNRNMHKHVMVAMSGGVDSSIAAYLLKNAGYSVTGVYIKTWDELDELGQCSSDIDYSDAQRTCNSLNIPLTKVDYTKEYWNHVFNPFLHSLSTGNTPNPDVQCNSIIKFGSFYDYAILKHNADFIATGHYAQTSNLQLLKSVDKLKDQTYYLSNLNENILKNTLFPIGHLLKSQVKELAKDVGLNHVLSRRESMGICFIGKRKFPEFIDSYLHQSPGNFITLDKSKIGIHQGLISYTIGQRARISGQSKKWFVVSKDVEKNEITVVDNPNHQSLAREFIYLEDVHWISQNTIIPDSKRVFVKYRYRMDSVEGLLMQSGSRLKIRFITPQFSIASGQHVAIYDYSNDAICIGGGRIAKDSN